jgi:hypothetical protein
MLLYVFKGPYVTLNYKCQIVHLEDSSGTLLWLFQIKDNLGVTYTKDVFDLKLPCNGSEITPAENIESRKMKSMRMEQKASIELGIRGDILNDRSSSSLGHVALQVLCWLAKSRIAEAEPSNQGLAAQYLVSS